MSRSHFFFFKYLNAKIPLTYTLANEYPSSNEISKKNGTVQGDCIACDALLVFSASLQSKRVLMLYPHVDFIVQLLHLGLFLSNFKG